MRVFVPSLSLLLTFGMVSGFVLPTITRSSFDPVRTIQPIPGGNDQSSLPLQEAVLFASKSTDDTTSASFSREPLSIAASLGAQVVCYMFVSRLSDRRYRVRWHRSVQACRSLHFSGCKFIPCAKCSVLVLCSKCSASARRILHVQVLTTLSHLYF